jgi:hypothetical protein
MEDRASVMIADLSGEKNIPVSVRSPNLWEAWKGEKHHKGGMNSKGFMQTLKQPRL